MPGKVPKSDMNSLAFIGWFSAMRMNEITASSSWKFTAFAFVSATGWPSTVPNSNTGPCTERIVR